MDTLLTIERVSKTFRKPDSQETIHVLDNISCAISKGEFVSIFGPNGCGKSTLLKIIVNEIPCDTGTIRLSADVANQHQKIGFIFQNYQDSLFPWKRAWENIALSWELRGISKPERKKRAQNLVESLALSIPLDNYPYELSSGQQQMTAVARAVASEAEIILMDEPFSSLDYQTKLELYQQVLRIWERTHITIVLVSHDIEEAIYLADRLFILSARPARIMRELDISLQRPRLNDIYTNPEFLDFKREAFEAFDRGLHVES